MGYPSPLTVASRKLSENVVVSISGFTRFDRVNFGARMALFKVDNSVVVWSALPLTDDFPKALELLTGKLTAANVSHLIIPDKEHTMAAHAFKAKYPDMKIIAMEGVAKDCTIPVDYEISAAHANKVLDSAVLREIGVAEPAILDNFEFVYLPSHGNRELVMYHKASRTVFEADLLFNLNTAEPMEQFQPATGFPKGYSPFSGWSYVARYMNPESKVGRFLFNKLVNAQAAAGGLRAIYSWDFDTLVMCHGNIIEKTGKEAFKKVFGGVLE